MAAPRQRDRLTGQFLPEPQNKNKSGGQITHGTSYYLRTGHLPSVRGRRLLARSLREFEERLRAAMGEDLTPQQEAMIRQVLRCENVLRLIELYLLRASPMRESQFRRGKLELQPCLAQSYGHFLNVQRQALLALGLDKRKSEVLDLGRYLAEKEAQKLEKDPKARAIGGGRARNADHGTGPSREINGQRIKDE